MPQKQGRRQELTPRICPLSSIKAPTLTYTLQTHTENKERKILKVAACIKLEEITITYLQMNFIIINCVRK